MTRILTNVFILSEVMIHRYITLLLGHKIGAMNRQTALTTSTMHSIFLKVASRFFNCCMLWLNWIFIFLQTKTLYTVHKNNGDTVNCYKQLNHSSTWTWVPRCERPHAFTQRSPWQQQIDILIQTPLWGMPGWLLCIHGIAFVFQPSNKSIVPGWSSLEKTVHWGTDVGLTGLHKESALNTVSLECFQDKWWRMVACLFRLRLWKGCMHLQ